MNKTITVLCVGVMLLLGLQARAAEVTHLELPAAYADFALNPRNGDIACVDAEAGNAVLFRLADQSGDKASPAATVPVGPGPVAIAFKTYRGRAVYAVVCARDARMSIINAKDFRLIERIDLGKTGAFQAVSSDNPEDPFIYFTNGREAGAVHLGQMKLTDLKLGDAKDFVISADGTVAYRRRSGSPSGFESLALVGRLTDPNPVWERLFYDHNTLGGYLPDKEGRFTVVARRVYTASLKRSVADLKIDAKVFYPGRPFVFGLAQTEGAARSGGSSSREPTALTIRAASTNTFELVGETVQVSLDVAGKQELVGMPSRMDRKPLRMIADPQRKRILVARMNRVAIVPLSVFGLSDEPMLHAEIRPGEPVLMGQRRRFKLEPVDPRVKVEIVDAPAGAKIEGRSFVWEPGAQDIRDHTVVAELSHDGLRRTAQFDMQVEYPSIPLPFKASGATTDQQGRAAVVWDGPPQRSVRAAASDG